MFDRTDLLCYACLPDGASFSDNIAAASRAGFTELSFWLMSIDVGRKELGSLEAVRALLDEHGMRATSLEFMTAWTHASDGEHLEELDVMLAAAEVFEPELVMVGCMTPEMPDYARAAANLREQCQQLGARGIKLGLEFLPWSALPNPQAVSQLVDTVAEDNLGFVIDTWHFTRAGMDYDALAQLPGDKVHFIQVSDALPLQPGEDIMQQTLGFRCAPGEGVVDWPRMLQLWRDMGIDCPIGTEMFSNKVKAMSLDAGAQYLYDTLQLPFRD